MAVSQGAVNGRYPLERNRTGPSVSDPIADLRAISLLPDCRQADTLANSLGMVRIASVEPVWGNGWLSMPNDETRDVPKRFEIEMAVPKSGMGRVVTSGHEFEDAVIKFSPRHISNSRHFNVQVGRGDTLLAVGYAIISDGG